MPPTISAITTGSTGPPNDTIAAPTTTVEAELRAQLLARLDGPRGAIEAAVPTALFTLAHLVTGELTPAVMLSIGSALVVLLIRSVQRCTARPAFHGLWGAGLAALVATWTGQALATFATAAAILARGQTPIPTSASPRSSDHRPHGGAR